jgi:predicted  nucleic acid-binding Zn-ribbon protein
LFTFDGVAILKYITVVHTSLFTMVQEKEISDLKAESSQIKIENRRLNDNVFDLMVDIEELEQYGRRNSLRFHNVPITKEL